MKKYLLATGLSTMLILSACGNDEENTEQTEATEQEQEEVEQEETTESTETTEAEESEVEEQEVIEGDESEQSDDTESETDETESNGEVSELTDGTYEIEMATVEITNTEILPPDEYDEEQHERLLVTYEVTSKVTPEETGEVDVSAFTVWLATVTATQETNETIANLDYGFTPEEYFDYQDTEMNVIKEGETVENVAIYNLENRDYPVTLEINQGVEGESLGNMEIDVSE